jgi:2-dehydro-3-deoxy-D-arabinonate dehydratase
VWQVPEPELALVLGHGGHVAGYTIGNDVSCRDIEGENPLYLPQAKIYRWSCAFGPAVWLPQPGDPPDFEIALTVRRGAAIAASGRTSTARMVRSFTELVHYLRLDNDYFAPTLLLTGTGIVPPDDFSLQPGDIVEIEIPGIGTLRNPAVAL